LSGLGAVRLAERRDVDAEDRQPIQSWFDDVLSALQTAIDVECQLDYLSAAVTDEDEDTASGPTRERPYPAKLVVRCYYNYCYYMLLPLRL